MSYFFIPWGPEEVVVLQCLFSTHLEFRVYPCLCQWSKINHGEEPAASLLSSYLTSDVSPWPCLLTVPCVSPVTSFTTTPIPEGGKLRWGANLGCHLTHTSSFLQVYHSWSWTTVVLKAHMHFHTHALAISNQQGEDGNTSSRSRFQ